MSLKGAREDLLNALLPKIDTYYGWGAFTAPCARIFPAEPWVELSPALAGGRRTQRWEIWAIAGRVDSGATFDELESLVQRINAAVDHMPKWSSLEWRRPTSTDMGGARYLACRGIIQTVMEV